jgi:hypothetical protein
MLRSAPARVRALAALALLATTTATGCAKRGKKGAVPTGQPAVLVFVNQALTQADVYVVPLSGLRQRVGTVQSGRTERLRVPYSVIQTGQVNIFARMFADGRTPRTGLFSLRPGETVQVTLTANPPILSVLPASNP